MRRGPSPAWADTRVTVQPRVRGQGTERVGTASAFQLRVDLPERLVHEPNRPLERR